MVDETRDRLLQEADELWDRMLEASEANDFGAFMAHTEERLRVLRRLTVLDEPGVI